MADEAKIQLLGQDGVWRDGYVEYHFDKNGSNVYPFPVEFKYEAINSLVDIDLAWGLIESIYGGSVN